MSERVFPINDERNHPHYGGCDGFGPNGECSECAGLIQCDDGSVIATYTGAVVKKAALRIRLQRAWIELSGGVKRSADELMPF